MCAAASARGLRDSFARAERLRGGVRAGVDVASAQMRRCRPGEQQRLGRRVAALSLTARVHLEGALGFAAIEVDSADPPGEAGGQGVAVPARSSVASEGVVPLSPERVRFADDLLQPHVSARRRQTRRGQLDAVERAAGEKLVAVLREETRELGLIRAGGRGAEGAVQISLRLEPARRCELASLQLLHGKRPALRRELAKEAVQGEPAVLAAFGLDEEASLGEERESFCRSLDSQLSAELGREAIEVCCAPHQLADLRVLAGKASSAR